MKKNAHGSTTIKRIARVVVEGNRLGISGNISDEDRAVALRCGLHFYPDSTSRAQVIEWIKARLPPGWKADTGALGYRAPLRTVIVGRWGLSAPIIIYPMPATYADRDQEDEFIEGIEERI